MRIGWLAIIALTSLGTIGCTKTPAYLYGEDLSNLQFKLYSPRMGVYPDTSILKDPNNPFATDPCTDQTPPDSGVIASKWDLQGNPVTAPVAAFYCWATLMALSPNGETPVVRRQLTCWRWSPPARPATPTSSDVKALGVAAFQSVLDNYPTAVTYDKLGQEPQRAPDAVLQGHPRAGRHGHRRLDAHQGRERQRARGEAVKRALAVAAFLLGLVGCRPDPGKDNYANQEPFPDGGNVKLPGPNPYKPGDKRLFVGAFYEGDYSDAILLDNVNTHLFIYGVGMPQMNTANDLNSTDRVEGRQSDDIVNLGLGFVGLGINYVNTTRPRPTSRTT